jgi:thiamine-monophosphate kinase
VKRRLAELGEDRLVKRLTRSLPTLANVVHGPGDDCAVIGGPRDRVWQLLKTDCVIEGIHFTRDIEPKRVGWKALCRAISDIAAMGGEPAHALLTIALPLDLELPWIDAFYAGVRKAARQYRVAIAGGETARSPGPIFINVALTGMVERRQCILRSGGKPGDAIYVTGRLGGSLSGRHLDFVPRVIEARWLANLFRPHAMMDLSDGLGADLPRLAAASACGYRLQRELIPTNAGASTDQAISDGEDYELLFAIAPSMRTRLESAWHRKFPRLPLTRIGELIHPSHTRKPNTVRGFDHFTPAQ